MPSLAQKEAKNEVDVLRCLKHPNTVAYCDSFLEGRMLCIVMEFADGGDLSQLIKRKKTIPETLRESEVLPIFVQCCLALHYVHKLHILHRDIKSQNIFLTLSGAVKLGDFGIAKVLDHTAAEAITMIGTPIYLAPEVCHSKPYGIKADVWSIGVVLYELLALAPPFTGPNMAVLMNNIVNATPKELVGAYSESLKDLVSDILKKLPEMRPTLIDILERPIIRVVAETLPAWSLYQPVCIPHIPHDVGQDLTMPRSSHRAPEAPPEPAEEVRRDLRRRPPLPAPDSARAASEFRQNREAALAAKARVLGRTGQRSLSAEPGPVSIPSSNSACERAVREAEHLLALQQAAIQARRDRQEVQQRLQAEKEANAARYQLEPLHETPKQQPGPGSAEHLADLQEAAAQARRDRRFVQQKIKDLEKNADSHPPWNLPQHDLRDVSQDGVPAVERSPRKNVRREEEHLLELQEARAQARRDRKILDAKRKALEANEASWDLGDSGAVRPRSPRQSVEAAEAKHVQALKEASAEARRERKLLQQKALDDLHGSYAERPSSGESDCAKQILAAKAEAQRVEEEQRYRELREASAQARRERKMLQQKVREIEWGDGHLHQEDSPSSCSGNHVDPSRPSENSKSQRLSTLSLAGKLSLSRPASEERSFQSIERTCEDPERMWRQMNALHTGVSAPPDVEVPDVPCLHTSPCSPSYCCMMCFF